MKRNETKNKSAATTRIIAVSAALALGICTTLTAQAATYDYRYEYSDGYTISATVTGVASSTGVTVDDGFIMDFNGEYNVQMYSSIFVRGTGWTTDNGFLSFSGLDSNAVFADVNFPANEQYTSFVYYGENEVASSVSLQQGEHRETVDTGRYSLVRHKVPEPTTFALIGLGLFGLLRSRHRVNT